MAAIKERRDSEMRYSASLVEWQTKHLAAFIGSAAQDKKQADSIVKAAEALQLKMAGDEGGGDQQPGGSPLEPRVGSYERLMAGLGGPRPQEAAS